MIDTETILPQVRWDLHPDVLNDDPSSVIVDHDVTVPHARVLSDPVRCVHVREASALLTELDRIT